MARVSANSLLILNVFHSVDFDFFFFFKIPSVLRCKPERKLRIYRRHCATVLIAKFNRNEPIKPSNIMEISRANCS